MGQLHFEIDLIALRLSDRSCIININHRQSNMTQLPLKRIPRRLPRLASQREISPEERAKRQAELEAFRQRCYQIFERVRPELIEDHYNWPILIEPDSGDYIMDKDELVAFQKAREKYPQAKFFFFRLNETGVFGKI